MIGLAAKNASRVVELAKATQDEGLDCFAAALEASKDSSRDEGSEFRPHCCRGPIEPADPSLEQ